MTQVIKIEVNGETIAAELADSACAQQIRQALPIQGNANTWGEEIYFTIGVHSELDETAKEVVELGDIGFWPPGSAICFFFGQTPMSTADEIRPASAVNIVGRITGDQEVLKRVRHGQKVILSTVKD